MCSNLCLSLMFPHQNLCTFLIFTIQVHYLGTALFWVVTRQVLVISFTTIRGGSLKPRSYHIYFVLCVIFRRIMILFTARNYRSLSQSPGWRITHFRSSKAAHSIYWQHPCLPVHRFSYPQPEGDAWRGTERERAIRCTTYQQGTKQKNVSAVYVWALWCF